MSAPASANALERLARYDRALRGVLSALDGATPESPAVEVAFGELQVAFQELGDLAAERARLRDEEAEAFEDQLEESTRLHAVLTASLGRDRERLLGLLAQAREARRRTRDAVGGDPSGRTCDMSA